jgi:hypothetical protein
VVASKEKDKAGRPGFSCGGGERDSGSEVDEPEAAADLTEEVSVEELILEYVESVRRRPERASARSETAAYAEAEEVELGSLGCPLVR